MKSSINRNEELAEKVQAYIEMQRRGEIIAALDEFYSEDAIMQENEMEPTVGKEANRLREEEFLRNIQDFRKAEVKSLSIGADTVAIEWHYDYDHREWGTRNYHQVSLQRWKNGKIVHERFYYGS
ncbi:MAG: nuclear transport factor 2 family protein [Leptospiraceae bacterium]